ncbi:receptor-like protein EIX2 [Corylus avellana]|uniref:receptor-like protein EIX2 n=1 Tax=Corylus avellana TaxID=13451 RepID=UPI00286A6AED|nr:receptor-like protein EIX2 [Corylus avellana]
MEKERQSLLKFKQGLMDDNGLLSSWGNHEEDCCKWEGVKCSNRTGHVVKLDLRGKHFFEGSKVLSGDISSSLLGLQHLIYLDLSSNEFSTFFPEFIASLTKSRTISQSFLQHYFWNHFHNSLEISHLNSSIFPWLLKFTNSLVVLDLRFNELQGSIPKAFGDMVALVDVDLSFNNLEGMMPQTLENLHNLQVLDLSNNNISGEVIDLTKFSFLRELYLSKNQLNGSLTKSVAELSMLQVLDVSSNSLEDLSYNFLSGSLPQLHSNSSVLNLSNNMFQGSITSIYETNGNLSYLDLSDNLLSGELPNCWGNMMLLTMLNLANNNLSRRILDSMVVFGNRHWSLPLRRTLLLHADLRVGLHKPLEKLPTMLDLVVAELEIDVRSPTLLVRHPLHPALEHLPGSSDVAEHLLHVDVLVLELVHSRQVIHRAVPDVAHVVDELVLHLHLGVLEPQCVVPIVDLKHSLPHVAREVEVFLRLLPLRVLYSDAGVPSDLADAIVEFLALKKAVLGELVGVDDLFLWQTDLLRLLELPGLAEDLFSSDLDRRQIFILDPSRPRQLHLSVLSSQTLWKDTNVDRQKPARIDGSPPTVKLVHGTSFIIDFDYIDNLLVTFKEKYLEYSKTLGLVKVINLSSNKLKGEISREITSLLGLIGLNLSRNLLTGIIPQNIGDMKRLESLDLSRNYLSGIIPPSLTTMSLLSYLNLANNNLSGRIPSGTQLQSFSASAYSGNRDLCGLPLPKRCPGDETAQVPQTGSKQGEDDIQEHANSHEHLWFYTSIALGFIVGFWGVCGSLLLKNSWRHAYFQFLERIGDKLYVAIVIRKAKLLRKFKTQW